MWLVAELPTSMGKDTRWRRGALDRRDVKAPQSRLAYL